MVFHRFLTLRLRTPVCCPIEYESHARMNLAVRVLLS
jgi:hypothetical protein